MKRFLKRIALSLCAAVMLGALASCGNTDTSSAASGAASNGNEKSFVITLYPEYAPETCENFEKLVSEGFYDGLTFHRVVDDFMAQGGDPNGDGTGGSGKTIKGEFKLNGVDNTLSHTRGVVSMARATDYNSASSQFFICYSDKDTFLDGQYAAFGKVTDGMDVVDSFTEIDRVIGSDGAQSKPVKTIRIVKAKMLEPDGDKNPRAQFSVIVGE
ncbi:MAG: peptidylprolyl isomerase [Oscillospiraceae bacterium]